MVLVTLFSANRGRNTTISSGNAGLFNVLLGFSFFCQTRTGSNTEKSKTGALSVSFLVYANACKAHLARYAYFLLSVAKYDEHIENPLWGKMYQYIAKEVLTD